MMTMMMPMTMMLMMMTTMMPMTMMIMMMVQQNYDGAELLSQNGSFLVTPTGLQWGRDGGSLFGSCPGCPTFDTS
eukprot:3852712-Amphidinium_carterae.1